MAEPNPYQRPEPLDLQALPLLDPEFIAGVTFPNWEVMVEAMQQSALKIGFRLFLTTVRTCRTCVFTVIWAQRIPFVVSPPNAPATSDSSQPMRGGTYLSSHVKEALL
jgi:hypothetical protein